MLGLEVHDFGSLGLIVLKSCESLGARVDQWIKVMREQCHDEVDSYVVPIDQIRFNNGEGKIKLHDTVRGKDLFILCDVGNYSCTYNMFGTVNRMGPDEHFQDIKRVLSAVAGKAHRVTVMMPLLYGSRQDRRTGRESLDCALGLQELERLGVAGILTFDAHNPAVMNAIPLTTFENIYPTYTMLKTFILNEKEVRFDRNHMTIISPDHGGMGRAVYYANALSLDVGMYYKRRDLTTVVNGKNPILQHEYIGSDVAGKDVFIVDDMIASGDSVLDIAKDMSLRGARKIFIAATFAFFTEGVEKFNDYYRSGMFTRVYATNLTYLSDEVKAQPWFCEVDMSKHIAKIITTLNHDQSISNLLNATPKIQSLLKQVQEERGIPQTEQMQLELH